MRHNLKQADIALIANAAPGVSYTANSVANLTTWWKADAITGLNSSDPVSAWNDSKGSNNLSGSGSTRPLYITNAFGTKPVVRFDGTDDVLSMSGVLSLSHSVRWTMFVVMAHHATPNGTNMVFGHSATNVQWMFNATAPSSGQIVLYQTGAPDVCASSGFTLGVSTPRLVTIRLNVANTMTFRINNTAYGTPSAAHIISYGTSVDINQMGKWRSPAGDYLKGDIAEAAVYNRVLTDTELDTLYTDYFKLKYGLA